MIFVFCVFNDKIVCLFKLFEVKIFVFVKLVLFNIWCVFLDKKVIFLLFKWMLIKLILLFIFFVILIVFGMLDFSVLYVFIKKIELKCVFV